MKTPLTAALAAFALLLPARIAPAAVSPERKQAELEAAIAKAADPVAMARAFKLAVEAGRLGFEAGLMQPRDFASPSTPIVGTPFWHSA